jgi:hypothetical protein
MNEFFKGFTLSLNVCVCLGVVHACSCLRRPEEGVRSPGAGVTGGYEHLCRVLGTELGSSASATDALSCWAISPLLRLFVCLFFRDRVSLYRPGCPGTHFVDQTGLELRNPPVPASQVLGLKACTTMPGLSVCFLLHPCPAHFFFFFLKIYLFIICKYTVAVFRHTRRGRQISLRVVVSHHVVAGI